MNNKYLNFEIDNVELLKEENDSEFVTASIDAFSSGLSRNNTICDDESLKASAYTIYEKPILFTVDSRHDDFYTHVDPDKSLISGFVIPNSAIFKEDGDRTILNVKAKIWSRYAEKFIDIFKRDGKKKKVSVEAKLLDFSEDENNGLITMRKWIFSGICVLGNLVESGIAGANMVLNFSKENAEYQKALEKNFGRYSEIDMSIPEKIKGNAEKGLSLYKEHKIGGTSVSLANARYLVREKNISAEKIKHMSKVLTTITNKEIIKNPPNDEFIKFMLYGGKEAISWIKELFDKMEEADNKIMSYFDEEISFPYKTMKDVNPSIKGIEPPVSLAQANHIASVAEKIGVSEEKNGWAIAIDQFKETHEVVDGHWVKKQKSKEEYSLKIKKPEQIKKAEAKFSLTSSQIIETLNNSLAEFKYGEDNWNKYWVYSFDEEFAYVHDSEDNKDYRMKYTLNGLIASVNESAKELVIQGNPLPVQQESYVPEFEEEFESKEEEKTEDKKEEEFEEKSEEDKEEKKEEDAPEDKQEEKFEESSEEKPEDDKEEDKKVEMSNDPNLDIAAFLAMLDNQTEDYARLVEKHNSGETDFVKMCGLAYEKLCKMSEEAKKAQEDKDAFMAKISELEDFKLKTETSKFAFEVETTIAEVFENMPKDKVEELREDSKNFTLETIDGWKNKVKAVAFEYSKDKKKDDGINRIAVSGWMEQKKDTKDYSKGWL